MAFSDNGLFAAVGTEGEIRWWRVVPGQEFGKRLYRWPGQAAEEPFAFSSDLKSVAARSVGSSDFAVRVRKLFDFDREHNLYVTSEQTSLIGHRASISAAAFASAPRSLTTVGLDGKVNVWDLSIPGREVGTFVGPWYEVGGITFLTRDGGKLLAAVADDSHPTAEIWDIDTGKSVALTGHEKKVWAVAYDPNKGLIATGSADKTAKIWDARTGKNLKTLALHKGTVREVAFSPNGQRLVTSSDDGTAIVWNVESGSPVGPALEVRKYIEESVYSAGPERVESNVGVPGVAFSPDGNRVATASADGTAIVWDIARGKPERVFQGHNDAVWKVAFSPDGTHLATASHDGTAKVWNLRTGAAEVTFRRHTGVLWGISYSSDGTLIATASADRTVRIWDAKTGKELVILTGHQQSVNRAVFSPDMKRVATSSEDGTVRVYSLDLQELIQLSKQRVPGEVTLDEQGNYVRKP
jgi:WD40 repeat protein